MVFKRRDRRSIVQIVADFVYPRGGWGRAFEYVKHRVRRLPDTPEKISRGIWAGVFTTFTPFYGLHFLVAVLIARVMRGNILASLLGTFFGNPLTYLPIAVASLSTGHFLLGSRLEKAVDRSLGISLLGLVLIFGITSRRSLRLRTRIGTSWACSMMMCFSLSCWRPDPWRCCRDGFLLSVFAAD